jgi:hypothetical protein
MTMRLQWTQLDESAVKHHEVWDLCLLVRVLRLLQVFEKEVSEQEVAEVVRGDGQLVAIGGPLRLGGQGQVDGGVANLSQHGDKKMLRI